MNSDRKIGIIGGIGPQATISLYASIIEYSRCKYNAKENSDYPKLVIESVPVPDFISNKKNILPAKNMLVQATNSLITAGATILCIESNTVHILLEELKEKTQVPFISMIELVVKKCLNRELKKVGLLGTPILIGSNIYTKALEKNNIEIVIPSKKQLPIVEGIIRQVIAGSIDEIQQNAYREICNDLFRQGAEAIILGCTELPLAMKYEMFGNRIINSTEILAEAIVDYYYTIQQYSQVFHNDQKMTVDTRSSQFTPTYGGEVEMLCIESLTGKVSPLEEHSREIIQKCVDSYSEPFIKTKEKIKIGYDSSRNLIEINTGVHESLTSNIYAAISAIKKTSQQLNSEYKSLLSLSFHPTEIQKEVYSKYGLNRSIYGLCCGQNNNTAVCVHTLKKIYKTEQSRGRGWNYSMGTLAASVQPWNSVSLDDSIDQLMLIQATGWFFILLTANSPFADANISGKRDYRLEMWNQKNGMLSTSRYKSDQKLMSNFKERIFSHAKHSKYLFSIQRPMIVPIANSQEHAKSSFYAMVQPPDEKKYSVMDLLKSEYTSVVDIKTGKKQKMKVKINNILNQKTSLYFPQYGGRFRINMPTANKIDPKEFANAIESENEDLFLDLLRQGGVENGGFLCIEGRTPAVVLPNNHNPSWQAFCIPFVLQTALLRNYKKIWKYMESTPLTWNDFAFILPEKANNIRYGFNTFVKGIAITELAKDIWKIAKESLTLEEISLIGNEIETILETKKAPAEFQMEFYTHELHSTKNKEITFERLIRKFNML